MAVIGYARVSTDEQNLDLQHDALVQAGCGRIFEDAGISAVSPNRPGFESALKILEEGDTLVIWKMDRAFRSLRHALDTLEAFEHGGIKFRSLTDQIDTMTAMGKFVYQITNAFGELERNIISERTKAGMEAARKRGKTIGRPLKIKPHNARRIAAIMDTHPDLTISYVAGRLRVSPRTLSRALSMLEQPS